MKFKYQVKLPCKNCQFLFLAKWSHRVEQEHRKNFRSQPLTFPRSPQLWWFGQSDNPEIFFDPDRFLLLLHLLVCQSAQPFCFVVAVASQKSSSVVKLQFSVMNQSMKDCQSAAMNSVNSVQDSYLTFNCGFNNGRIPETKINKYFPTLL